MQDKSTFEVIGAVVRKYVAPSGKFASLKVETSTNGFKSLHDLKTFDGTVCRQIETVGIGEMVRVMGELGTEQLKNKAKDGIELDGYKVYVAVLKVTKIEPVTEKATQKDAADDDRVPF